MLYTRPILEPGKGDLIDFQVEETGGAYPAFTLLPMQSAQLTIACYGYNFEPARVAAFDLLMEHEIFIEIILFSQLSPFDLEPLFSSLARTRNLLTIEEGTLSLGWGAEVVARAVERMDGLHVRRVAALDLPVASAKSLEDAILPSVQDIVSAAVELVRR